MRRRAGEPASPLGEPQRCAAVRCSPCNRRASCNRRPSHSDWKQSRRGAPRIQLNGAVRSTSPSGHAGNPARWPERPRYRPIRRSRFGVAWIHTPFRRLLCATARGRIVSRREQRDRGMQWEGSRGKRERSGRAQSCRPDSPPHRGGARPDGCSARAVRQPARAACARNGRHLSGSRSPRSPRRRPCARGSSAGARLRRSRARAS